MKQKEVDSIQKLHMYLNEKQAIDQKIYHYTNIGTIIKILRSGKLLLNNLKNVNDAMEAVKKENMNVASFTYEQKEAVHYWAVYGRGDPYSIRISVDKKSVLADEPEYMTREGNAIDACQSTICDVVYLNMNNYTKNKPSLKHNNRYFSLLQDETTIRNEFPGLCKSDVWEHEKETRLLVRPDIDEDYILLKLPKAFFESMTIVFSPWIDDDIREELSKPLLSLLADRYGIKKDMRSMRQSSIHNQIRLR